MFFFQYFSDTQKRSGLNNKTQMAPKTDTDNWVDEYGDYLYGIAFFRVGDMHAAEDIVQDTFMAALRAWDTFQGKSTVRTWLVSILKRKIIDSFRKNKHFISISSDGSMDDLPDFVQTGAHRGSWKPEYAPENWPENPGELFENREFQTVLQECIKNLPANLAAIFTLREIQGLTTEDLCKEFSISSSNLWVILHRARTQLRRCLKKLWFAD